MKLTFNCPTCATVLNSREAMSSGPCPECQTVIQVSIQVTTRTEPQREIIPGNSRRPEAWRCSGKPHGTY